MSICIVCKQQPAIGFLTLTERTGYLVYRTTKTYEGDLCRDCGRRLCRKVQLHNLLVGWLGTISFILTPFTLAANFYNYYRFVSGREPVRSTTTKAGHNPAYKALLDALRNIQHGTADDEHKRRLSVALIKRSELDADAKRALLDMADEIYPKPEVAEIG